MTNAIIEKEHVIYDPWIALIQWLMQLLDRTCTTIAKKRTQKWKWKQRSHHVPSNSE